MSYCSKCGTKVQEEMSFCPKCGAQLKAQRPSAETAPPVAPQARYKAEKREKEEKGEKEEKQERMEKEERREKREFSFAGPLIGGLFLLFVGLIFYLTVRGSLRVEAIGALFLVLLGILIIAGVAYAAMVASRRHPTT